MHFIYGIALVTIFCLGTIAVLPTCATVPSTNPNLAVRFVNPNPGDLRITMPDAQHLVFDQYPPMWNGTAFNCTIYIENLDVGWAISGASFSVSYNASLTNIVGTTLDPAWSGTVDTITPGIVNVAVTTASSLSGDVLVLTITFNIQGQHEITFVPPYVSGYFDQSNVVFTNTSLEGGADPIPTNPAKNGVVIVYGVHVRPDYEAMVIGITVIPPKSVIGQGFSLIINVTGVNYGSKNGTFTVTAYANATPIGSRNITVLGFGLNSSTVSITWNTTGFNKGKYQMSATPTLLEGESGATISFTDGWITVATIGDITGPTAGAPDGKVDIRDLAAIAKCYGASWWNPNYNVNLDLTGPTPGVPDGKIDIRDIAAAAKNFGLVDP